MRPTRHAAPQHRCALGRHHLPCHERHRICDAQHLVHDRVEVRDVRVRKFREARGAVLVDGGWEGGAEGRAQTGLRGLVCAGGEVLDAPRHRRRGRVVPGQQEAEELVGDGAGVGGGGRKALFVGGGAGAEEDGVEGVAGPLFWVGVDEAERGVDARGDEGVFGRGGAPHVRQLAEEQRDHARRRRQLACLQRVADGQDGGEDGRNSLSGRGEGDGLVDRGGRGGRVLG